MRALAMVAAIGLAGPAAAYTVTLGAAPVGEKPSTVVPYGLPASTLAERPMASTLAPVQAQSSFGLKDMDSATLEKTQASLTQLGARQVGNQIIVTLPGDVLFDFDKADIRADARPVLSQLAQVRQECQLAFCLYRYDRYKDPPRAEHRRGSRHLYCPINAQLLRNSCTAQIERPCDAGSFSFQLECPCSPTEIIFVI